MTLDCVDAAIARVVAIRKALAKFIAANPEAIRGWKVSLTGECIWFERDGEGGNQKALARALGGKWEAQDIDTWYTGCSTALACSTWIRHQPFGFRRDEEVALQEAAS